MDIAEPMRRRRSRLGGGRLVDVPPASSFSGRRDQRSWCVRDRLVARIGVPTPHGRVPTSRIHTRAASGFTCAKEERSAGNSPSLAPGEDGSLWARGGRRSMPPARHRCQLADPYRQALSCAAATCCAHTVPSHLPSRPIHSRVRFAGGMSQAACPAGLRGA
jgi:hypothetical protein